MIATQLQKEALAEFIGTFMLILVGAGAVAVTNDLVVAAFAHGMILVGIITQFGQISGAHVNPAVTLSLLLTGKIELPKAIIYVAVQFAGAAAAAVVLRVIVADMDPAFFAKVDPEFSGRRIGQTVPAAGISIINIIVIEFLLTFFLVSSVYHAGVYLRWQGITPLLIAFTLIGCIMFGGPLTGASLNPARTFGPAFFAEDTQDIVEVLSYFVGILGGGAAAGFVQNLLFASDNH